MPLNILNAEPGGYSAAARSILAQIGSLHEEACDRSRLLDLIDDIDVLIVRLGHRVDRELITRGKKLKAIVTATTGLNHIDTAFARKSGIEVLSLKGEREFLGSLTATAELTWALLLALYRKIPYAHTHVINGGWDRDLFRGNQLKGKTLGIIGFGRLGSIVAEYGHAFHMNVIASDPYVTQMPKWVERLEMYDLLNQSDVVSLHVNLDDSTTGFFGHKSFEAMKQGAVLINTSRGELIDEQAMLMALESGKLAGVALDVLCSEAKKDAQWPTNSPLWRYAKEQENIVLTPHIGGATVESMEETEIFMANKLAHFFARIQNQCQ